MPGFHELRAWQAAVELAGQVEVATRMSTFRGAGELGLQLRRAALSVSSNIAEGYGRGRRADFARFLLLARGSAAEVQSQLAVAAAAGRLSHHQYQVLRGLADRSVALITRLHAAVVGQQERD